MNTSHTCRTMFRALLAAAMAFAVAGCVAPVGNKPSRLNGPFYAESERHTVNPDGTFSLLPEIITPSSGKSIAVTDIAYKQEFREFFYDEKISSKTEILEPHKPAAEVVAPQNEYAYSKRAGIERKVSYGELHGVAADIRGRLIKSGYRVVAGRPAVVTPLPDDRYFDILGRIKSGDFLGADFVLYGVLTEITINDHNESIIGTRNSMQFHVLDLAIDFSLIDTQSGQVVASFTAMGSGREQRLDGKTSGYKPSLARMIKQASLTMADDVALQLNSQNLEISQSLPGQLQPGGTAENLKRRNDEDARSLRVYR